MSRVQYCCIAISTMALVVSGSTAYYYSKKPPILEVKLVRETVEPVWHINLPQTNTPSLPSVTKKSRNELLKEAVDYILPSIRQVESGGNNMAVGDNGKAAGPYQIHRIYWEDAVEQDPSLKEGIYPESCFELEYSERVVHAYMQRWAPKDFTIEQLVRIHNGGPAGHRKSSTMGYWAKVNAILPPPTAN
jgi:hypothetical protein